MTFSDLISFSKLFTVAAGLDKPSVLSSADVEVASEALKHMADESPYWTDYQKELYKSMVDVVKENTKRIN